jgi:hypothetical protein
MTASEQVTGAESRAPLFEPIHAGTDDSAARWAKTKLLGPKNLQLYRSGLQIRRPSPHRRPQGHQERGEAGSRAGRSSRPLVASLSYYRRRGGDRFWIHWMIIWTAGLSALGKYAPFTIYTWIHLPFNSAHLVRHIISNEVIRV